MACDIAGRYRTVCMHTLSFDTQVPFEMLIILNQTFRFQFERIKTSATDGLQTYMMFRRAKLYDVEWMLKNYSTQIILKDHDNLPLTDVNESCAYKDIQPAIIECKLQIFAISYDSRVYSVMLNQIVILCFILASMVALHQILGNNLPPHPHPITASTLTSLRPNCLRASNIDNAKPCPANRTPRLVAKCKTTCEPIEKRYFDDWVPKYFRHIC